MGPHGQLAGWAPLQLVLLGMFRLAPQRLSTLPAAFGPAGRRAGAGARGAGLLPLGKPSWHSLGPRSAPGAFCAAGLLNPACPITPPSCAASSSAPGLSQAVTHTWAEHLPRPLPAHTHRACTFPAPCLRSASCRTMGETWCSATPASSGCTPSAPVSPWRWVGSPLQVRGGGWAGPLHKRAEYPGRLEGEGRGHCLFHFPRSPFSMRKAGACRACACACKRRPLVCSLDPTPQAAQPHHCALRSATAGCRGGAAVGVCWLPGQAHAGPLPGCRPSSHRSRPGAHGGGGSRRGAARSQARAAGGGAGAARRWRGGGAAGRRLGQRRAAGAAQGAALGGALWYCYCWPW